MKALPEKRRHFSHITVITQQKKKAVITTVHLDAAFLQTEKSREFRDEKDLAKRKSSSKKKFT